MAPHPPFKPSSIAPLPLPSPFTQFSYQPNMFDPTKELPKSYVSLSDHLTAGFSDCNDSYDRAMNYGPKVQKTAQNYANYSSWNTLEGRFEAETLMADDESGISSPPLWKSSPQHENNVNYRCLSPSSRAQAIARGQKELMEMVSKMPESCYELSLKDLVEHQPVVVVEPKQESFAQGRGSNSIDERKYKNEKQNSQKQQLSRSGSLVDNGGFLLKMVFPVSLGSKKKKKMKKNTSKKNDPNTNGNSKVSPKPTVADASAAAVAAAEATGASALPAAGIGEVVAWLLSSLKKPKHCGQKRPILRVEPSLKMAFNMFQFIQEICYCREMQLRLYNIQRC
ncbi:hypothetical protein GOBAR_DD11623 [Gossypium barbadense]|nr:hypothetical protein GOBAR_DD11623 [Gossypium barbadense]